MFICLNLSLNKNRAFAENLSALEGSEVGGRVLKKRVLIAEDERELRDVLREILNDENVDVFEAADGLEALNMVREGMQFDAVVCDITMPRMNGLELLEQLRSFESFVAPVILLTGHGEKERIQQALRLGAFDYITKPCNFVEFAETVFCALEVGLRKREIHEGMNQGGNRSWLQRRLKAINLLKLMNNRRSKRGA